MSIMDAILAQAMGGGGSGGGIPHVNLTTTLKTGQNITLSDPDNAALTAALNQGTPPVITAHADDGSVYSLVFDVMTFDGEPGGAFVWTAYGMTIQIADETGTGKWHAVYGAIT